MEDPEENPFGPPPDASGQAANTDEALAGGDKKQRQPSSDGGPAKKKARTTTIELQGVPSDGEQTSCHVMCICEATVRLFTTVLVLYDTYL